MKTLFDKVNIGNLTLKNRFMFPPMTTGYEERGMITEKSIEFYRTIARGGVSLIIIGDVSPVKTLSPIPMLFFDENIPSFQKLTDAVHKEEVYIGAQIFHPEYDTEEIFNLFIKKDMVALRQKLHHDMLHFVNEVTIEKLLLIQQKMVDCAIRASKAGFDMIQIHGDRIIGALSSPILNKRTDNYGGSLENRTRFARDLVKKIRLQLPDIALDYKLAMIRTNPYLGKGGPTIEEGKWLAQELVHLGVDSIHACQANHTSVSVTIPAAATAPFMCFTDFAEAIKSVVNVPVSAVGRIVKPEHAQTIIDNDQGDIIALGRALLADSQWVNKLKNNQPNDIRYCIMCNKGCTDKIMSRQSVGCAINGNNGLFSEMVATEKVKNILVIGAGPSGLETARVLNERGHKVTIWEKESMSGGQLNIATLPDHKTEMNNIKLFLNQSIQDTNIKIEYNKNATIEKIKEFNPAEIVLATGATPKTIKSFYNHRNSLSAWDALRGRDIGKNIVIIGAGSVGVEVAGFINNSNNIVKIVEATENVMIGESSTLKAFLLADLEAKGIEIIKSAEITEVKSDSIVINNQEHTCDTLVYAVGAKPNNELENGLEQLGIPYTVIGDAKEPRLLENAIREAYELAIKL